MNGESQELSQLQKLKRQKEILAARIQKAEALHKNRERKEETRRKILIGSYFLDKAKNEDSFESIVKELDSFLTRNSDRKLFGLPSIESSEMAT